MNVEYIHSGKITLKSADEQTCFIQRMFGYDSRYFVLMSPFWNYDLFYKNFITDFYDALSRGVEVFIICKKADEEELSIFFRSSEREHLHILGAKDFHAKLYFNDTVYLISSMNMTNLRGNDLGIVLQEKHIGGHALCSSMVDYIAEVLTGENREFFLSFFEEVNKY